MQGPMTSAPESPFIPPPPSNLGNAGKGQTGSGGHSSGGQSGGLGAYIPRRGNAGG